MTKPLTLTVHNFAFPTRGRSNAAKAEYRTEEDLYFNAPGTLEDIRQMWPVSGVYAALVERWKLKTWQDWLMWMLPHVAEAYGLHRNDVLKRWVNYYGISLCFGGEAASAL